VRQVELGDRVEGVEQAPFRRGCLSRRQRR
jgi:hypothetical protein